jgi:hypothetical protein
MKNIVLSLFLLLFFSSCQIDEEFLDIVDGTQYISNANTCIRSTASFNGNEVMFYKDDYIKFKSEIDGVLTFYIDYEYNDPVLKVSLNGKKVAELDLGMSYSRYYSISLRKEDIVKIKCLRTNDLVSFGDEYVEIQDIAIEGSDNDSGFDF